MQNFAMLRLWSIKHALLHLSFQMLEPFLWLRQLYG